MTLHREEASPALTCGEAYLVAQVGHRPLKVESIQMLVFDDQGGGSGRLPARHLHYSPVLYCTLAHEAEVSPWPVSSHNSDNPTITVARLIVKSLYVFRHLYDRALIFPEYERSELSDSANCLQSA